MMILSLDQATTTGYAVAGGDGVIHDSGIWKLADKNRSGESRGMRYVRFRQYLEAIFAKYPGITIIVHEQTLLRGGAATEIANGLKALILECAENRHVEVSCVHTSELKKFAAGSGKAEKEDMIKACKLHGKVIPRDDNEADAVCIALWAASKFGTFPAIFKADDKAATVKKRNRRKSWLESI